MATREQLESRLAALKTELVTVEGTPTEVYSRIVGYYRSVRNWNAGKRAEFTKRQEYRFPSSQGFAPLGAPAAVGGVDSQDEALLAATGDASSYLLFSRAACPNCPPVKEYLRLSGLPGVIVDVDTDEGLELARRYEVLSTPTAIMLSGDGVQLLRARTRAQLEPFVRPADASRVRAEAVTA